MRAVVPLLLFASVAGADASAPAPTAPAGPTLGDTCPPVDGPATRAWQSPVAKRFQDKVPGGPPVYPRHVTDQHLLYTTEWHSKGTRSVILDAHSGKQLLAVRERVVALVEKPGGELAGALALPLDSSTLSLLDPATGVRRWTVPHFVVRGGDSASVALAGDTLLVALYHRISTGSALIALDLHTGAVRWVGDVQQLQVSHSKYSNDVTISVRGREAVLLGLEAGGCHLQTFDLATGARRSAKLNPDATAPVAAPSPTPFPPGGKCPEVDGPATRAWHSPVADRYRPPKLVASPRQVTARHILYTSDYHDRGQHALIVDATDGARMHTVFRHVTSLIEDPSGQLIGLVALDEKSNSIDILGVSGSLRWRHPLGPNRNWNHTTVALAGDRLVVALYHRISSGSALIALSYSTGALLWKADVQQLNIGHSEYMNDVSLELTRDTAIMTGLEAGGCYRQTFSLPTGRRLASSLHPSW